MEWRVEGTRARRVASSAACTDHASWHSTSSNRAIASGEGATVLSSTFALLKSKREESVREAIAENTASGLSSGSPIPMKTMLSTDGSARAAASRRLRTTVARISSAERLRTMPIAPVAQKRHPRTHPTWLLTHNDVLARALRAPACCCGGGGMRTVSTARPSARRSRSLVVPSLATDTSSVRTSVGSAMPEMISRAAADTVNLRLAGRAFSASASGAAAGSAPMR
eukprot:1455700-Rhodomonas_salina.1